MSHISATTKDPAHFESDLELKSNTLQPRPDVPLPQHPLKKKAIQTLLAAGTLTMIVIWANVLWLFGSLYNAHSYVHRLEVLVVDFDGGLIGSALTTSIQSIAARPGVPTFTFLSARETSLEQVRDKVWHGDVWAAVWANAGQTEAFNSYLTTNASSTSGATPSYDPSAAYTYTGLQTRYFTVWSSYVLPVLLEATGTAGGIVNTALQSVYRDRSGFDGARRSVLANPTGATFENVSPMPFTVRVLLNTVGVVIIILFQFFFLMGQNGIFTGMGLYRNTSTKTLLTLKYPIKIVWTLLTSLSVAGLCQVFDEGYRLGGKNFIALWAVVWVFALISYSTVAFLLAVIPLSFLTNFILTLIMTSVAATVFPIDVQNVFYRISYIYPSHAYWQVAMTIYGRGSYNRLYIYLPVLATWLIVGEIVYCLGAVVLARKSRKPVSEEGH
ncbi:hypothetical protein FFLO_05663 [Filobasidium floriforme]|uniref:DUF3533 domain-containing protein n=1 Tax=Filobasidium floriforme TaxID=5210 RepID=A0A8K0JH02_9TREE|nr:uncharacterized protein HD553DRAFT_318705 [Filobasidium floriforme]KAG7529435.1 hypothetical protein FFLO_05663 [Filobasidium floriforme]KAH8079311.1 hypothetical protein HD553DRAFT_318705 [Filobasidium floriforme]